MFYVDFVLELNETILCYGIYKQIQKVFLEPWTSVYFILLMSIYLKMKTTEPSKSVEAPLKNASNYIL